MDIDPKDVHFLTPEETNRWWQEVHANVIKPNAERIAGIFEMGEIAVVVYKLHPTDADMKRFAKRLGWSKFSGPVLYLQKHLYQGLALMDEPTRQWLAATNAHRLLLVTELAIMLMYHDETSDKPWQFWPGSTEEEMKRARN